LREVGAVRGFFATPVTRHGVRVRRVEIAAQGGLTEGE